MCAEILGLEASEDSSPAAFRGAFQRLCLANHPLGKPTGARAAAARAFRDAREAFYALRERHARRQRSGKLSAAEEGEFQKLV